MHIVFLTLSVAVLTASALLSVQGPLQVNLPLVGESLPMLCHWKRFTGIDCPGCGMTRCFISLAHGDIGAAWRFNPAGFLLFALVAAQIPYRGLQLWRLSRRQEEFLLSRTTSVIVATLLAAMMAQWVWKLFLMAFPWNG
jgi:hypothetical protein